MGSRQSFETPHSRVPSAMIGQYTFKPDTHSNRDTGAIPLYRCEYLTTFYYPFCILHLSFIAECIFDIEIALCGSHSIELHFFYEPSLLCIHPSFSGKLYNFIVNDATFARQFANTKYEHVVDCSTEVYRTSQKVSLLTRSDVCEIRVHACQICHRQRSPSCLTRLRSFVRERLYCRTANWRGEIILYWPYLTYPSLFILYPIYL